MVLRLFPSAITWLSLVGFSWFKALMNRFESPLLHLSDCSSSPLNIFATDLISVGFTAHTVSFQSIICEIASIRTVSRKIKLFLVKEILKRDLNLANFLSCCQVCGHPEAKRLAGDSPQ